MHIKKGERFADDSKGGNQILQVLPGFIPLSLTLSLEDIEFVNLEMKRCRQQRNGKAEKENLLKQHPKERRVPEAAHMIKTGCKKGQQYLTCLAARST